MDKETLNKIGREAANHALTRTPHKEFIYALVDYKSGARSKTARDYWVTYGFEKARLHISTNEGTCGYKYQSREEVLAELDKEQER